MNLNRKLIGSGKIANIYLDNGYAYKSFRDEYPLEWIAYEVNIQNEIHDNTKLCIPKAELLNDIKEIKMEYIQGYTLAERMRKEKYKFALEDLVDIQLSIYKYSDLKLDHSHEVFTQQIKASTLDSELKEKALHTLTIIEKKNILCHFDIHFLNIMFDQSDYYIIDWVNAKLGNPILDIARTYVILKQYAQRLANKYLKMMVHKGHFQMEELQNAISLMAILRLLEGDVGAFREKLMDLIT